MGDSLKSNTGSNNTENETAAKVILWCTPRSISTALTKCLSFVPNTDIWFEPFGAACYYGNDARYPDCASVLGGIVDPDSERDIPACMWYDEKKLSYMWCKQQLEDRCNTEKNVFMKDMAYNIDGLYDAIPNGYKHTFIIREPYKVIRSWKKVIYSISDGPFETFKLSSCPPPRVPAGFFFRESYNLYNYVKAHYDPDPIVIDSDELLMNPSGVLKAYCNAVGIPYCNDLLQWEASPDIIKTWNISKINLQLYLKTYYAKAFSSSEFMKPKQMTESNLSIDDKRCVEFCMPFNKGLLANRIRV